MAEAAPIIEKYRLHKAAHTPFPLYRSEEMELIISGMTPTQSAIAATFILTCRDAMPDKIVNIGICASTRAEDSIGKCYTIHKIVDTQTQKVYHLPRRQSSLLPQTDIACFAKPQRQKIGKYHLIDMESSGFYLAAEKFLPKEQIFLIKIVSDHVDTKIPDASKVNRLIEVNLSLIEDLLF